MSDAEFVYDYIGASEAETYELENQVADPEQRIEGFMGSVVALEGAVLVDVGAGGGFHACRFAERAGHVFAIEPAPLMLRQLYRRLAVDGVANVSVVAAKAQEIPLRDGLADGVHSRFAYFFGPENRQGVRSCEPGIVEALRLLKPGGCFFIVDNALTSGRFAEIVARYGYSKGWAGEMQEAMDRFYAGHGFDQVTVESCWSAPDRETLQRVMKMEFGAEAAGAIMGEIEGTCLSYHYRIYYQVKPVNT